MSDITSQFSFSSHARSGYSRMLSSIMRGMNSVAEANSHRRQIETLEALSDAELAEIGLRRDQIVAHVFRNAL